MVNYDKDGERLDPYVEDSTKGKSLIQPLNYKGDMLTQAWIDSRVIATLSRWLESNGFPPRSLSEVARRPLEVLVEYLVDNGSIKMIEDTATARRYLQDRYRVNLNRGRRSGTNDNVRGGKNILHNQILSSRRQEIGERVVENQAIDAQIPDTTTKVVDPEFLRKAIETYTQLANAKDQTKEDAVRAAKDNKLIVEGKSRASMTIWEQEELERKQIKELNAPIDEEFLKSKIAK